MNIIIEGCDGTGKSTLAKYLCETLGLHYWHESEPRTLAEYQQMLSSGGVCFDRFCFGQFVYNLLEDRKMTEEELATLVASFPQTHTLLIYVDAPTEVIVNRMIARGEGAPEIKDEMIRWIKNIRGTYRSVLKQSGARYTEINGERSVYDVRSNN